VLIHTKHLTIFSTTRISLNFETCHTNLTHLAMEFRKLFDIVILFFATTCSGINIQTADKRCLDWWWYTIQHPTIFVKTYFLLILGTLHNDLWHLALATELRILFNKVILFLAITFTGINIPTADIMTEMSVFAAMHTATPHYIVKNRFFLLFSDLPRRSLTPCFCYRISKFLH